MIIITLISYCACYCENETFQMTKITLRENIPLKVMETDDIQNVILSLLLRNRKISNTTVLNQS